MTCSQCFLVKLWLFVLFAGIATVSGEGQNLDSAAKETENDGYQELVAWVEAHGGRVDKRMSIDDIDGLRGVIALEDIEEDVELLHCPWKLVIGSSGVENQMRTEGDMCNVVKIMASEFRLGEESTGWPYLKHIELPRLGAMWDLSTVAELQGLPPSQDIDRHLQWYSKNCGGGDVLDEATTQALVSFVSRASAVGMVPIYDLLNHHNGLKNAKLFVTKDGVDLRTVQPVLKNQQLYLSYGLKTSSQMYRDYGFVEDWPSLWSWRDSSTHDNHVFALFPDGIAAIHPSKEFLKEIWKLPTRSLEECQKEAFQFTHSLEADKLHRFTLAAKRLLEGLPTTWREDEEILRHQKKQKIRFSSDDTQSTIDQEDITAAIYYRLTFKRALSEALSALESVPSSRLEEEL